MTYAYTIEQFGGVGDGLTDNTSAWQALVKAQGAQPITVDLDATKSYYFGSSITVPSQWTVDGHTTSPETLDAGQTWNPQNNFAIGWYRFSANPAAGDLIWFGYQSTSYISFVSNVTATGDGSQAAPYQVAIGANFTVTLQNLLAFLNGTPAKNDSNLSLFRFTIGNFPKSQFATFEFTAIVRNDTVANYFYGCQIAGSNTAVMQVNGVPAGNQVGNGNKVQANLLYNEASIVGGTMLMAPTASITYSRGCTFRDLRVINAALPSPPSGSAAIIQAIAGFAGTAFVPVGPFTHEVTFDTVFIAGFDKAISYNGDRARVNFVRHDCRHGIDLSNAYETWEITRFLANGLAWNGYNYLNFNVDTSLRLGNHIHVHDGASGGKIDMPFSYGHACKVLLGNEFQIVVTNAAADGAGLGTIAMPAYLDVAVTAGGSGYSNPTAVSSNGDKLAVTLDKTHGSILAITTIDPAKVPATTAPTIRISDPTGSGAVATGSYANAVSYQSYGNCDRFCFNAPASDVAAIGMKLSGVGGVQYVNGSLLGGGNINDITVTAGANVSIVGGACATNGSRAPVYIGAGAGSCAVIGVGVNAGTSGIFVDASATGTTTLFGNYLNGGSHNYGVSTTGAAHFGSLDSTPIGLASSAAANFTDVNVGGTLIASSGVTLPNSVGLTFVDSGRNRPTLLLQSDNNLVFYGSDAGGTVDRVIFSVAMLSSISPFILHVPLSVAGSINASGTIATGSYTVSNLPAPSAALQGARAFVTDANAPTFLNPVNGGGGTRTPVFCSGSGWLAG